MTDKQKPGIPEAVARILAEASQQRAGYNSKPREPLKALRARLSRPWPETAMPIRPWSNFAPSWTHSDTDNGQVV